MVTMRQKRLLLDTNVWIDLFEPTRPGFSDAKDLVDYCLKNDIALMIAPTSLKDFYYQLNAQIKRRIREEGREITPSIAVATEECAWGCAQSILDYANVVSMGLIDVGMARSLRGMHRDLEDNMIVAVAMRCEADCLVTSDKRLIAKCPVPSMNPFDARSYLHAMKDA